MDHSLLMHQSRQDSEISVDDEDDEGKCIQRMTNPLMKKLNKNCEDAKMQRLKSEKRELQHHQDDYGSDRLPETKE